MADTEEIKRQIAALQAQLDGAPASPPKKRKSEATVIAPATPSPKKKRKEMIRQRDASPSSFIRSTKTTTSARPSLQAPRKPHNPPLPETPSLLSQLKSLDEHRKHEKKEIVPRSEGFSEKPVPTVVAGSRRDECLAIVEELTPGPAEHKPPPDDPNFEKLEPNSGIRLRSRVFSNDAFNDHLYGRYFLPPSLLYSVVRLDPSKQGYEVPVDGDWVTIAVVAERGDVKLSGGPGNTGKDWRKDGDDDKDKKGAGAAEKKKDWTRYDDEDNVRKGGKKYVNLKLIDLGLRSRTTSSASDVPRGTLKGDAQLTLLLFESDHCDKLKNTENGKEKVQKIWRGGSGGAFEECYARLKEGTVIALLNPKVLRPFQNTKTPSNSSILALTPPSASAILVIGYASDLGKCSVLKRDGKPCGSWVDRRVSRPGASSGRTEDVCEYHIQTAVRKTKSARAEFSIGTTGLSTSARKHKSAYDPDRKWGLKPDGAPRGPDGESTYVIGGLVASSSSQPAAMTFVNEKMGRDSQERAKRKDQKREEKALMHLLEQRGGVSDTGSIGGGFGGREALDAVRRAREASQRSSKLSAKAGGNANRQNAPADGSTDGGEPKKKSYSAEMVKKMGFNPLTNSYSGRQMRKKAETSALTKLADLSNTNRDIRLGPPPGAKKRSGVVAPVTETKTQMDYDDASSDLEIVPSPQPPENMDFLHSESDDE